ncbi:MAG: tetratricopeptide repeat protein [Candidatus Omnitrophica bacterium]|nr:tetratricopeptide repeat protein [Candidatus Omnitrophota bacterium]
MRLLIILIFLFPLTCFAQDPDAVMEVQQEEYFEGFSADAYDEILDRFESQEGNGSAEDLLALGTDCIEQEKYEQAEEALNRGIELIERSLGEDSVDLMPFLKRLAELYKKTGRKIQAEKIDARWKALE